MILFLENGKPTMAIWIWFQILHSSPLNSALAYNILISIWELQWMTSNITGISPWYIYSHLIGFQNWHQPNYSQVPGQHRWICLTAVSLAYLTQSVGLWSHGNLVNKNWFCQLQMLILHLGFKIDLKGLFINIFFKKSVQILEFVN
jgi:hypothetical protein